MNFETCRSMKKIFNTIKKENIVVFKTIKVLICYRKNDVLIAVCFCDQMC